MRVGIVTIEGYSYGAVLQAFALNDQLGAMGYRAENIDYNDGERWKYGMGPARIFRHLLWREVFVPILGGKIRNRRYDDFKGRHIHHSARRYDTSGSLADSPPVYDAYVAGSDQIWNPSVLGSDYHYLLDFVPPDRKKISYASSFGRASIPPERRDRYRELLSRFDCLSVRELSGALIIEELCGRQAQVVLDPTLLLSRSRWESVAAPPDERDGYILCYGLPSDPVVTAAMERMAKGLAHKTGLRIVRLGMKEYNRLLPWKNSRTDAGPSEFVSLFLGARYVITNSFHGAAFATNFNIPLLAPVNGTLPREKALHTRIVEYLTAMGRECSIIKVDEAWRWHDSLAEAEAGYGDFNRRLQREREKSLDFIRRALGEP